MVRHKPHSAARRPWAAVFVALALLGAACGGDDTKKVAADQPTTSVTEASTTTSTEATTTTTAAAATTTSMAAKVTTTTKKATTTTTAPTTTTTLPKLSGDITVLAAASLTEAFTEIGKSFEAANPGVHVKFSFDSSSTLATQANNGAPADVFASADEADAGIVYLTDVRAAGDNAAGVDIPDEHNVIANNPIAVLKQSAHPDAARVWIDYLLTPQGQAVLAKFGFIPAA